jgi:hypothetical protein
MVYYGATGGDEIWDGHLQLHKIVRSTARYTVRVFVIFRTIQAIYSVVYVVSGRIRCAKRSTRRSAAIKTILFGHLSEFFFGEIESNFSNFCTVLI